MKKTFFLQIILLLLSLSAFSQTLPSWFPTQGLVAFYPMSGNAQDHSGNGNHGTVHGALLISDRFGNNNAAYQFNGDGDYIDVTDNASFNPTSSLSLSMWVQTATPHSFAGVMGKWNNLDGLVGEGQEQFCFNVSDTHFGINFGLKTDKNPTVYPHEMDVIYRNGNWNHYVGTYDGLSAKLYVNGELVHTLRTSGSIPVYTQKFEIGRIAGGQPTCATSYYFTGNIDDVGMWNRALTPEEIRELYSECPGFTMVEITPLGPLAFCQGGEVILKSNTEEGAAIQWFRNDTLISGANDTLFTARNPGSYSVMLSKNMCQSISAPVIVEVLSFQGELITSSGPLSFCAGDTVVLTAAEGDSVLWNTGDTTQSITVTAEGNYSVEITRGECKSSASVMVTVHHAPEIVFQLHDDYISLQSDSLTLTAEPEGGIFSGNGILNGKFLPSLAGLGKSVITYSFTSPEGCSGSSFREIVVYDTTGVVCSHFDTVTVVKYDTLQVMKYDTVVVTQYDTIRVFRYDTVQVIQHDTLYYSRSYITPDTMVITVTRANTGDQIAHDLVTLYPNPAKTVLNIRFTEYAIRNNYSLVIRNALGQQLFVSEAIVQEQRIKLDSWANGVYFVYLEDSGGFNVEVRKIIIQ